MKRQKTDDPRPVATRREFLAVAAIGALGMHTAPAAAAAPARAAAPRTALPRPLARGRLSVEEALRARRSVRSTRPSALSLADVSQLLWAAQGATGARGFRTAPSAGALYPLETYLASGQVEGLSPGVYKYHPGGHELARVVPGDRRAELAAAALGQPWIAAGAAVLALAAVYERTARKYGGRAARYVHMEAGCAAENVYLQAEGLGLSTVLVGAFHDERVRQALGMEERERPLALMPLGRGNA